MPTSDAPLQIGHVALTVRDLTAQTEFYRRSIGLDLLSSDGSVARLGAGGRMLVELRGDPAARPVDPAQAGLFHTAFLLPSRDHLGRWLRHAAETGIRLSGASDHRVSDALYLDDPEGNGIEIYVDRPRSDWPVTPEGIAMTTERLDLERLAAEAAGPWAGMPEDGTVGHVHLRSGALEGTEPFWAGTLGLTLTARYRGANFFGAGGYHHHIGTNIWNSRGAGPRPEGEAGLALLALSADPGTARAIAARAGVAAGEGGFDLADPWGIPVRLLPRG